MTCPDSVQIPSNRWLKFMSGRRRKRGRLFGDAPEAPRVSPKPYARSRATRPPTVNRPASAIPLTETCAASETRRVARLRAASCATPASLPSASPRMGHGRDRRRLPFGEWTRACLSRGGSGGARVSRGEFFGPDGTGDAPVRLAGPMRKRKPEVLFTSRSPVGGIHRADRRVLRSKMATVVCPKKLGASCSPRRSDGQRVCQPLPSRKIRDKGAEAVGRDSKWRISRID